MTSPITNPVTNPATNPATTPMTPPPAAPRQYGLLPPKRRKISPLTPEEVGLAASKRAAASASIEASTIIYRAGGDPIGERERQMMSENPGKTMAEIDQVIIVDPVLSALGQRGIMRR
ncbi:hypothetical protein IFR05_008272 [Cadophora sp. M221]|nr:hypothetical protein IFR05_008272 [Cadophora sp. M221]